MNKENKAKQNKQKQNKNKQKYKPRYKRSTIFQTKDFALNYDDNTNSAINDTMENNKKRIHTELVKKYLDSRNVNKILSRLPPEISKEEMILPREPRRTPSQLRTNKLSILFYYLNKINPKEYPSPLSFM